VGGVGEEKLFSIDFVASDGALTLRRGQPVHESLTIGHFHARVLVRVHEHHAVLVEKAVIALDEDGKAASIFERQPSAPIRKGIGVERGGGVQRRSHPLPDFFVPPVAGGRVDPGVLPIAQFGCVRARAVAARDKRRLRRRNLAKGGENVFRAADAGRIVLWSDDHKVVIRHVETSDALAFGHEFVLGDPIMDEHDISVATATDIEGLAGSDGHDFHSDASFGSESRQQKIQKARTARSRSWRRP
jgi:hypothetical protein